jgi:signal transduction histidine kinase
MSTALPYMARFLSLNHLEYAELTDPVGTAILNLTDSSAEGIPSRNPLVKVALSGSPYGHGILRENGQIYIVATVPVLYKNEVLGTITVGEIFDLDFVHGIGKMPGFNLAIWKDPDRKALVPREEAPFPPVSQILTEKETNGVLEGKIILKNVEVDDNTYQTAFFTLKELGEGEVTICANYRSLQFLKEAGMLTLVHLTALLLLVLILAIQYALWISKRVTEPLNELAAVSRRMADMDFSEHVPIQSDDEVSALAAAFNDLSHALKLNISQKDDYAAELSELNEKLESVVAKRTEELEHANLRLQREIREKDEFLRTVSHDLGAPLRNIGGLAHMIQRKYGDGLSGEGLDRLGRIRSNVERELGLIEELLELSRIKTRPANNENIDLMEQLGQIRQMFSYPLEERGIHLVVMDILPTIKADKDRITQLFQNLIDNAIKYIGDTEDPEIRIGYSENKARHLFWVQDNGIGIPDEQKDNIFGVFRRGKSKEVSSVEGKGVGLAAVKTIVEMCGGDIWLDSEVGEGSTFYFTLGRDLVDQEPAGETIEELDSEFECMRAYEADFDC